MAKRDNAAKDARRRADLARKAASVEKNRQKQQELQERLNEERQQREELQREAMEQETKELSIWRALPSDDPNTGKLFVFPPRCGGYQTNKGKPLTPKPGFNRTDGLLVGPWNRPASWIWLYTEDLELVGFISWKTETKTFDMSVSPSVQGQGIGRKLVHYCRTVLGASLMEQTYTEAGAACCNSYLRELFSDDPERLRRLEV